MDQMTLAQLGQWLQMQQPQRSNGPMLSDLGGSLILSDESPYPVLPGQQYAGPKQPYNPMSGFSPLIPDPNQLVGSMGGPVSAAGKIAPKGRSQTEKAFEQVRKEGAGMTREQRREQMRQQGQEEFDRVQNMSDAEYEAELDAIRRALQRK